MINRFAKLSILINLIFEIIILKINYDIAEKYLSSDSKTQALGLFEIQYFYQYYLFIFVIIAIIFSILSKRKNENQRLIYISIIFSIISIILIFSRIWRLMIL